MKTIHIEICKSEWQKNCFNLRIGDITGAIEHSNISYDELISDIKDEINSQDEIAGVTPITSDVGHPDTFSTNSEPKVYCNFCGEEIYSGIFFRDGVYNLCAKCKLKQENKSKGRSFWDRFADLSEENKDISQDKSEVKDNSIKQLLDKDYSQSE